MQSPAPRFKLYIINLFKDPNTLAFNWYSHIPKIASARAFQGILEPVERPFRGLWRDQLLSPRGPAPSDRERSTFRHRNNTPSCVRYMGSTGQMGRQARHARMRSDMQHGVVRNLCTWLQALVKRFQAPNVEGINEHVRRTQSNCWCPTPPVNSTGEHISLVDHEWA